MPRRATKIVATLGPASSDAAILEQMIRAGVNVVRLNFSHGKAQDHIDRARLVREAAAEKPQQAKQQPVTKSQDETRGRQVDTRA